MKQRCMVCSGTKTKLVWKKDGYKILKCEKCDFGFLVPYLTLVKAKKIYDEEYFVEKRDKQHLLDAKYKLHYISKQMPKGARILDFGCGNGEFIGACLKRGYKAFGYDISPFSVAFVGKKYHAPVTSSVLRKSLYKKNFFDVIVAFDVIEHMPNYREALELFYFWLKPGGYLFVATPNICSWDKKILGRYWYGFSKIPQHINYFSPESMSLLLHENAFTEVKVRRWGFVRNLDFVLTKLLGKGMALKKIGEIAFFVPMVNMMVEARK